MKDPRSRCCQGDLHNGTGARISNHVRERRAAGERPHERGLSVTHGHGAASSRLPAAIETRFCRRAIAGQYARYLCCRALRARRPSVDFQYHVSPAIPSPWSQNRRQSRSRLVVRRCTPLYPGRTLQENYGVRHSPDAAVRVVNVRDHLGGSLSVLERVACRIESRMLRGSTAHQSSPMRCLYG